MIADSIDAVAPAIYDDNIILDLNIFETEEIRGELEIKDENVVANFAPPAVVYDYVVGQFYQARESVAKVVFSLAILFLSVYSKQFFFFVFPFLLSGLGFRVVGQIGRLARRRKNCTHKMECH